MPDFSTIMPFLSTFQETGQLEDTLVVIGQTHRCVFPITSGLKQFQFFALFTAAGHRTAKNPDFDSPITRIFWLRVLNLEGNFVLNIMSYQAGEAMIQQHVMYHEREKLRIMELNSCPYANSYFALLCGTYRITRSIAWN